MVEYLGKQYIDVDQEFLAPPAHIVAPNLIGCVLLHDNRGVETGIMLVDDEGYGGGSDRAFHLHPENRSRRNRGSKNLTPFATLRIHGYRDMWAIDIVCGKEGEESTVLVRAGVPVAGMDIMAERRSKPAAASKTIKECKKGYEKQLCRGPCSLAEALGIYPLLDGASLLKPPFRLLRPVEPVANLLNGPRVGVTQDKELPWRWGHPGYSGWVAKKFPQRGAN
ncbi:DNA-3-methyladenine glycosylase [Bradyrhizobium sp. HKCCYLRH2015]|uniref:DNA-3-methyladenine glycosylase n=1 Tax=Bradyrhizobium TaxID=374 RepID=UPI003EC152D9